MTDRQSLTNGRGRIRRWWCRWYESSESGPWAIRTEWTPDADGYVPVCYDHSELPHAEFVAALRSRLDGET